MRIRHNILLRGYNIFIGDKELREAEMDYYDLPKDKQWLGGDSPYVIGGRNTDISQIAYSLSHRVRELYPINQVPEKLAQSLQELEKQCRECEIAIRRMVSLISDYRQ